MCSALAVPNSTFFPCNSPGDGRCCSCSPGCTNRVAGLTGRWLKGRLRAGAAPRPPPILWAPHCRLSCHLWQVPTNARAMAVPQAQLHQAAVEKTPDAGAVTHLGYLRHPHHPWHRQVKTGKKLNVGWGCKKGHPVPYPNPFRCVMPLAPEEPNASLSSVTTHLVLCDGCDVAGWNDLVGTTGGLSWVMPSQ